MKYRARTTYPGIQEGTIFYPVKNEYGVNIYRPLFTTCDCELYLLHQEDMENRFYFEPIPETSEEEDEAARRYMWVPKRGSKVFWINSTISYDDMNWEGDSCDWFYFRAGMIFRTKVEAERATELMKNGRI